jgi:hypothetical protein
MLVQLDTQLGLHTQILPEYFDGMSQPPKDVAGLCRPLRPSPGRGPQEIAFHRTGDDVSSPMLEIKSR